MRVVAYLDPHPIEFGEQNSGGPYPYLKTVGTLQMAARVGAAFGIASTESTSVVVQFDKCGGKVAGILRRPMRSLVDIYSDDGSLFFRGIVSNITYGDDVALEVGA